MLVDDGYRHDLHTANHRGLSEATTSIHLGDRAPPAIDFRSACVAAITSHGLEGPVGTAACTEFALAIGGDHPVERGRTTPRENHAGVNCVSGNRPNLGHVRPESGRAICNTARSGGRELAQFLVAARVCCLARSFRASST